VARPIPPSLGAGKSQFANLGTVTNTGIEVSVQATALEGRNVGWFIALSAWGNRNRLRDLGTDLSGNDIPPILLGGRGDQRFVEGYPLGGYWARPITAFADANSNGIIDTSEVTLGSAVFHGTPFPTRGASLSTTVSLSERVRLSALFDYRGGHHLFNGTEDRRCRLNVCRALNDAATPLDRQAIAVAGATIRPNSVTGYIESADFVKLRELAATFDAPGSWAAKIGARNLSLTLAGRNLATWTGYSGFDPELSREGDGGFLMIDFLTQPQVRYVTARLNVEF
jgi:hypothetical protein